MLSQPWHKYRCDIFHPEKIKETHPDKDVMFMESFDAIADYVSENADPGDLVLTMGAGDIYKVGELILEK